MRKLAALVFTFIAFAVAAVAAEFPKVGAPAPAVALKNQEAKEVKLDDFRGKWVVLYFYPKDFTSGCTIEAQSFQRDLAKYTERNAQIVGVSVDTPDSHAQFCTKESLKFQLLSDPEAVASTAYNSAVDSNGKKFSARNTFLIDPKGNLVRIFSPVKPAGHSEEVLAALDELQKK